MFGSGVLLTFAVADDIIVFTVHIEELRRCTDPNSAMLSILQKRM